MTRDETQARIAQLENEVATLRAARAEPDQSTAAASLPTASASAPPLPPPQPQPEPPPPAPVKRTLREWQALSPWERALEQFRYRQRTH
jgi:hypothetical protein